MGAVPASRGPLTGLRVLEFSSIGPGPHCGMLLSDLGADVVRVERPGGNGWPNPIMDRGRATLTLDIRAAEAKPLLFAAVEKSDVVIEGMRPGVMERLGYGPDVLLKRNPRLIYGRMTGWGQAGPLAHAAGHDINYIALTGALAAMGHPDRLPSPPLNLVGDFGGGSLYLAFGIMAALWEREKSGLGQVIDAAIIDGVASMMTMFTGLLPSGRISMDRSKNILAGAAPFYRCFACADGLNMAVGPIEPQFFAQFLELVGAPNEFRFEQTNDADWERQITALALRFATKSRADWSALFEGTDACVTPVLTVEEAPEHPHLKARQTFIEHEGLSQAAPAPRFSRTPGAIGASTDGRETLRLWGVSV